MPSRPKIVVPDFIAGSLQIEQQVLGDLADVVALNADHEDKLAGHVDDADALMIYHTLSVSERTISRLSRCKLIVRCGVGYDNVDGQAARQRGIPLANV